MATLDGSSRATSLGRGISVRAPGLRGRVESHDVTTTGDTRAPDVDGSGPALDAALTREGFLRLEVITLDVAPVPFAPPSDVRSPVSDVDGVEVTVPDLGDDVAQVLLAVDENGVVSWNFPVDDGGSLAPTTRGAGDDVRFIVPAFASEPSPGDATDRGVFGLLGRKVLELVALPLSKLVVPPLAGAAARLWESKSRIARVRTFTPANYASADVPSLEDAEWQRLATGRSLWFVHGTFVSTDTAFQAFPAGVLSALSDAYGGRVAAIDHHTLGIDPLGNADLVRELVPDGLELDVDIVCHSRGGLVARALAGQGGEAVFNVRRIVHVASANHGTALATPSNLVPFIDRITTHRQPHSGRPGRDDRGHPDLGAGGGEDHRQVRPGRRPRAGRDGFGRRLPRRVQQRRTAGRTVRGGRRLHPHRRLAGDGTEERRERGRRPGVRQCRQRPGRAHRRRL